MVKGHFAARIIIYHFCQCAMMRHFGVSHLKCVTIYPQRANEHEQQK